ncbi:MAG: 16S rRNA (uracil(1498)-N(3))-methyltransferase [Burkholderiaceae bacterium]
MLAPRLFVDPALVAGTSLVLPSGAARHVQVLRLQPGDALTLFDGNGGEYGASVLAMGRSDVSVQVGSWVEVEREMPFKVTLALGMPANDRMDALVEKATELGAAVIQPLVCARSVLRLSGERAAKRLAHWRAVAVSACEQSGRTRVPLLHPVRTLSEWLADLPLPPRRVPSMRRWLLSLSGDAQTDSDADAQPVPQGETLCLSGPEGGLDADEEALAMARGFRRLSLGPRVLRADTAPLALLAGLAWQARRTAAAP